MLRIILTTNYSPWSPYSGGGQISVHNLATSLVHSGCHVHVINTKACFESIPVPRDLKYRHHWVSFLGFKSKRSSTFRRFTPPGIAKKIQHITDGWPGTCIVHSNGEEGACLGPLREKLDFRMVVTPRYPNYPLPPGKSEDGKSLLGAFLSPADSKIRLMAHTLQRADQIVYTSRFAKDLVRDRFQLPDNADCRVIRNGVTPCFLNADWRGSIENGPILFYGRLEKSKGIDTLLRAYQHIHHQIRNPLMVIGRGSFQNEAERFIKNQKLQEKITLHPWMNQEEIARWIARSAVVVLPSREESFGNTVAESLSVGAPVISGRAGSIPELIADGETGFMTTPGSVSELKEKILTVLQNTENSRRIAQNGNRHASSVFQWQTVAEKHIAMYEKLLGS